MNGLRIGTLNVRGLKTEIKLNNIAADMESFKIDALAVQETHMAGNGVLSTTANGKKFHLFWGNRRK